MRLHNLALFLLSTDFSQSVKTQPSYKHSLPINLYLTICHHLITSKLCKPIGEYSPARSFGSQMRHASTTDTLSINKHNSTKHTRHLSKTIRE